MTETAERQLAELKAEYDGLVRAVEQVNGAVSDYHKDQGALPFSEWVCDDLNDALAKLNGGKG